MGQGDCVGAEVGAAQVKANQPMIGGSGSPRTRSSFLQSPRAALEPERVPLPSRFSRRGRPPVVVGGNGDVTAPPVISVLVRGGVVAARPAFPRRRPRARD